MKDTKLDQIKKYCEDFLKSTIQIYQKQIKRCRNEILRLQQINQNLKNQLDSLMEKLSLKNECLQNLEKSLSTQVQNPEEPDLQKVFVDYPKTIIKYAQKTELCKNFPSKSFGNIGIIFKGVDNLAIQGYKNGNFQCLRQVLKKQLQRSELAIIWRIKN